jgi:hypothetical protein
LQYTGIIQREIPRFEATFALKMESAIFFARVIHIYRRACLHSLEIGNIDAEKYDRFNLKILDFVRNISAKDFYRLSRMCRSRTLSVV